MFYFKKTNIYILIKSMVQQVDNGPMIWDLTSSMSYP